MAVVWLDTSRCTGCGACVEVCPSGALTLLANKARLDVTLCRGCEACIQACPVGALQPVLEVEADLAVQTAPLVLQSLGRLLLRPRGTPIVRSNSSASITRQLGRGRRQTRQRRRGRR